MADGPTDDPSSTTGPEVDAVPDPAGASSDPEAAASEFVPDPAAASQVPDTATTEPAPTGVTPVDAPPVHVAADIAGAGPARGLSYAVDIVFCVDVTGSMTPILDAVKANALRFYEDVQTNLTDKGKNVDQLRVRVLAFRDFSADPDSALTESGFFPLPEEQVAFSRFVSELTAEGGGDAPESGLEALALAINSPWTTRGDRRRQVIVVWTDQPAHPLNFAVLPPDLAGSVPKNFSALTDLWEDPQGPVGGSTKRLILFAPDGAGWSDISANWENVVHHPSQAGAGLSDVDYGTIVDSIGNSV